MDKNIHLEPPESGYSHMIKIRHYIHVSGIATMRFTPVDATWLLG